MAQQSGLLETTEKVSVGQDLVQDPEEQLLTPEQGPVAESDGEASSGDGTPDAKETHFKKPVQESTPYDKGALAVEVERVPTQPGSDEFTVRTREEQLSINPASDTGKFSVQETGEGGDQDLPSWHTTAPPIKSSYKDEHAYELKVTKDCKAKSEEFPTALGLIVLFACSVAAPSQMLDPVPGVVKGVDKMDDTFSFLGYAVLRLPVDLASWQYRAAMKAVASVSFPESYRHIFVYFTGHGGKDSIHTPDGNLKLEDITNPFSPNEAPHLECLTKIFILDTCSLSKHTILHSLLPHSVLLFPAHPGYPAFAKPDDCGLLTQHLAPALRTSSKSFGEIVIDVTNAIIKEIENNPLLSKDICQEPLLCQTLKAHVCLVEERMEAMTPLITIQEVGPTSMSIAISSPPSSVQFHLQHLYLSYKCEGAEQWTQIEANAVPGGTVPISNLSHGKHYTVKAVAVYPDNEKISSQEMPCDMPTEVKPVLHQDPNYFCVDSVKFEVQQPAKKDDYQMRRIEVVCQCEKTQEPKPVEKCENDRFRISKLEPGVQYTVTATAHYPNEQSVSDTKSFEIPICNVKPEIKHRSGFQKRTSNSITVSVTAPPQANKYRLEKLSVQLWPEYDGEPRSQPIRLDQRVKTATFRELSSSTTYVAKAIANYPNKEVSSDEKKITTLTSNISCHEILCHIFMALLILCFFIALLIFLIRFQRVDALAVTKLGLQGDTIIASDFHSRSLDSVTITECPEEGDDSHTLMAALVKKSDIIKYTINCTGTINSSATTRVSLLEDEYFLQESFMAVNICLSSHYSPRESSRSVTVTAFVFDSSDDNQKFLHDRTDGTHSSLYNKVLQVGTTSKPICTWVNYSVASPAYYYLSLGEYALGRLAYSADLYLHEKYLNFSDYEGSEQYCSSDSEIQPCTFEIHESLEQNEYVLVTNITYRPDWFSLSTHVCVGFNKNRILVVIVPATLGTITASLIALEVVIVFYKCIKKRVLHKSQEYMLLHSTADDGDYYNMPVSVT